MELQRKIIRIEDRNFVFFGTVRSGVMTVTHAVDISRSKMYSFYHGQFMGKDLEKPFECGDRRKMLATARRKYGIAEALCFERYRCELTMQADANGDNDLAITDRHNNTDVMVGFVTKHWEIKV